MAASRPIRVKNPVVLRPGATIGSNSAERDDEFLFDCFVSYPPVDSCLDVNSSGTVLIGRTGAGKTAIIRYLMNNCEHVVEIDPSEMAMSYVANSDALNFVHAIGADLDHLFQVLWKHVLCIEFIRLRWKVSDEMKSHNIFMRFFEHFNKNPRKQKALRYLEEWQGKFWISMDENIKELTTKFEGKLEAELGGEISKFRARGQYDRQLSVEKKSELVARARQVIDSGQLAELGSVIDILAEDAADDDMNNFYILIDKLDDKWADTSIRFRLIRSIIETLKSFKKITNLKVVVALRSDILERSIQETRDITYQREKIEDYFIRIKWSKLQLKELIQKRILHLFKHKYTKDGIQFDDIFRHRIANTDPFDYILTRTLMRPRDVISFINECLKVSQSLSEVTASNMRKAEAEYSRIRKESLEEEWFSVFPTLSNILNYLGSFRKVGLEVGELQESISTDDLALEISSQQKIDIDHVYKIANAYCTDVPSNQLSFIREIIAVLYRVGAIGIKLVPGDKFIYSHIDDPLIIPSHISDKSKIRVHPMLHATFRLENH